LILEEVEEFSFDENGERISEGKFQTILLHGSHIAFIIPKGET